MSDECGPWIAHDGKGCPCVGMWVQAQMRVGVPVFAHGAWDGRIWEGRAKGVTSWVWPDIRSEVIRYRIRKPLGVAILDGLLANLPENVDAFNRKAPEHATGGK